MQCISSSYWFIRCRVWECRHVPLTSGFLTNAKLASAPVRELYVTWHFVRESCVHSRMNDRFSLALFYSRYRLLSQTLNHMPKDERMIYPFSLLYEKSALRIRFLLLQQLSLKKIIRRRKKWEKKIANCVWKMVFNTNVSYYKLIDNTVNVNIKD